MRPTVDGSDSQDHSEGCTRGVDLGLTLARPRKMFITPESRVGGHSTWVYAKLSPHEPILHLHHMTLDDGRYC